VALAVVAASVDCFVVCCDVLSVVSSVAEVFVSVVDCELSVLCEPSVFCGTFVAQAVKIKQNAKQNTSK
jgi:hypothetical protein